jgi:hypothetical protein
MTYYTSHRFIVQSFMCIKLQGFNNVDDKKKEGVEKLAML